MLPEITSQKLLLVLLNHSNQQQHMEAGAAQQPAKFSATFFRCMLLLTVVSLFFSCKNAEKWIEVDPAFSRYIDAYTTGVVSKTSAIRIQLAGNSNTGHTVGEAVAENLFSFSPAVKGKAVWVDASTIEFKPTSQLQEDQLYEVSFKLGKVTTVAEKKLKEFKFNVKTIKPSFVVRDAGLRSAVKNKMFLTGELETADVEDGKSTEALLTATQAGKTLPIKWQHNDAAKLHTYTVEGIERTGNASNLRLAWNGKPMKMEATGEKQLVIPAAGDFKVMNIMAVNEAQ
jgi:alpha-2-macroglobulin